jgi:hypothetical protein
MQEENDIIFEEINFEYLLTRVIRFQNVHCLSIAVSDTKVHRIFDNCIYGDSKFNKIEPLAFIFLKRGINEIELQIDFQSKYESFNILISTAFDTIKEIAGDYQQAKDAYFKYGKYVNMDLRLEIVDENIFNVEINNVKEKILTPQHPFNVYKYSGLIFKAWDLFNYGSVTHGQYIIGDSAYNYVWKCRPLSYTIDSNKVERFKQYKIHKSGLTTFEQELSKSNIELDANKNKENLFPSFFCLDRNEFVWKTLFEHFFMNKKYLCVNFDSVPNRAEYCRYDGVFGRNPSFGYKVLSAPPRISDNCFILSKLQIGDDLF